MSDKDQLTAAEPCVLDRPVRPQAWWRMSIYAECWPCVTVDEKEAEFWRSEGLTVVELGDVADAQAEIERLRDDWETRSDGKRVRKDRWEWAVRRIAALLVGNRKEFECDDVVEGVRLLLPRNESRDDAEALVHAAQNGFMPNTKMTGA